MAATDGLSRLICQMGKMCVSKQLLGSKYCSSTVSILPNRPSSSGFTPKQRNWIKRVGVDKHGVKTFNPQIVYGTVGEGMAMTMNTEELDRMMPTADTMRELFNGTPYEELPVVFVKATKNNTIINTVHVRNFKSTVIINTSARKEGFKNAKKKTTIAGQATGMATAQKLLRRGIDTVRVVIAGLGPGRMSSVSGIASSGVTVVSISDRTFLPEYGPRPRKVRRI
uniref:Mitochondrial ribosomal protein S11 n=1 Tax=Ditylenchus dipsaci TaxID=166011 RepID=A0A915DHV3_9BILA